MNQITTALVLAVAGAISLAISGPGTRANIWHFRVGLLLFAAAGLLGLAAVVVGLLAVKQSPKMAFSVAALGLLVALPFVLGLIAAIGKPPIHDVSTDVDDPPQFRAIREARADGAHRVADIKPTALEVPPADALRQAQEAGEKLGWEIVSVRPEEGIMEATATTSWFGFKDDIVVRVRPQGNGSRIDVRSTSRVGTSDIGANAARIRRFQRLL